MAALLRSVPSGNRIAVMIVAPVGIYDKDFGWIDDFIYDKRRVAPPFDVVFLKYYCPPPKAW